jgi:hypothetical protein
MEDPELHDYFVYGVGEDAERLYHGRPAKIAYER